VSHAVAAEKGHAQKRGLSTLGPCHHTATATPSPCPNAQLPNPPPPPARHHSSLAYSEISTSRKRSRAADVTCSLGITTDNASPTRSQTKVMSLPDQRRARFAPPRFGTQCPVDGAKLGAVVDETRSNVALAIGRCRGGARPMSGIVASSRRKKEFLPVYLRRHRA
jgi:hypothetical protein